MGDELRRDQARAFDQLASARAELIELNTIDTSARRRVQIIAYVFAVVLGIYAYAGPGRDKTIESYVAHLLESVGMQSKVPTPTAVIKIPEQKSTQPVEDTTSKRASVETKPGRDWLDITDKLVDWLTKLIGSTAALFGTYGIYLVNLGKKQKASGKHKPVANIAEIQDTKYDTEN